MFSSTGGDLPKVECPEPYNVKSEQTESRAVVSHLWAVAPFGSNDLFTEVASQIFAYDS